MCAPCKLATADVNTTMFDPWDPTVCTDQGIEDAATGTHCLAQLDEVLIGHGYASIDKQVLYHFTSERS